MHRDNRLWPVHVVVFSMLILFTLISTLGVFAQDNGAEGNDNHDIFLPMISGGTTGQAPDQAPDQTPDHQPSERSLLTRTNQLIVGYTEEVQAAAIDHTAQVNALSEAAEVSLTYVRELADNAIVVQLPEWQDLATVETVAQHLLSLPEVEYAEPDLVMQIMRTPNDPAYKDQWHYFAAGAGNYGINLPAAWDITTGSANVVVAVIDTGVRNHVDLAGRLLPGYDFISDPFNANDGNGRDNNADDPGDWLTLNEALFGPCPGDPDNSSWHGTHVAGTIAANSNNGSGVAGVNWQAKILPVRVLGKCGGFISDIADGIRWSAGLPVAGVPNNANPAKVINMSLGGQAACPITYQNALNAAMNAGSVVVVAAGNNNANAGNFTPANCHNVITVAATDRSGDRASYSNFGNVVDIAAPGGETNPVSSNGVLSTLNLGTTVPTQDSYAYYQGTSMATPHVAGVISLMFSVNPNLSPAQVTTLLQTTVLRFPNGSGCTTATCGAGIVDAAAAVRAAQGGNNNPPAAFAKSAPANGSAVAVSGVTFTWNASNGASRYEYCVDTSNNNNCDNAWVNNAGSTNVELGNLQVGATYYWQVRAVNSAGTTLANNNSWWRFTVQNGGGAGPGAFVKKSPRDGLTRVTNNTVLRWQKSSKALRYEACADTTNNNQCDGPWTNLGKGTKAVINGMRRQTTYYWQVRAINADGVTEANNGVWWSFTTR